MTVSVSAKDAYFSMGFVLKPIKGMAEGYYEAQRTLKGEISVVEDTFYKNKL